MIEDVWVAIGLLFTGIITDVIWALYIYHLSRKENLAGALYSVGTGICTVVLMEAILYNVLLTGFWLAGLFIGTYYSTRIENLVTKLLRRK